MDYEKIKKELVRHLRGKEQEIVIVCIGTDRNTGDSFGPFTGDFLTKKALPRTFIYGTIDQPVTAINLEEVVLQIKHTHPDAFVIGLDAALGEEEDIGDAFVRETPIRPGSALGKKLPEVGHISIVGIVNRHYSWTHSNSVSIGNTRLSLVLKMAKQLTHIIEETVTEHVTSNVVPFQPIKAVSAEPTPLHEEKNTDKTLIQKLFSFKKKRRLS